MFCPPRSVKESLSDSGTIGEKDNGRDDGGGQVTKHRDVISDWIEQCQASRKLTKWEADFIDSIAEQFDARGSISDRQEEILERIYAEKT